MVDKYIKEILSEHGKVYVPGIGLIYKNFGEEVSIDPFILNQPKYTLHIDQEYTNDEDTWLIYAAARGEHINIEDAEGLVKKRVEEIKTALDSGNEVSIERVGTIVNESGKLEFSQTLNETAPATEDENFGIPEQISIAEEEREIVYAEETPAPVIPVDNYPSQEYTEQAEAVEQNFYSEENYVEDEEDESGSKKGLIIAIVIFLLLTFGVTYYFLNRSSSGSADKISSTETISQPNDEEAADVSSETPADGNEVTTETNATATSGSTSTTQPLAVKEAGKRYYIIVGAFTINENAQKLKRRLESKGIKAKIIEPGGQSSLHRVSLSDFEELDQALASVEAFKKTYGNSLWILKY